MVGKYPACVLMLDVPPVTVDVNVHPAKAEVRFSDEKVVFNCVYFAVKNALMASGLIYEFQFKDEMKKRVDYKAQPFVPEEYEQPELKQSEPEQTETVTQGKKEEPVFKSVSSSEYAKEENEVVSDGIISLSSSKTEYGSGGRVTFAEPSIIVECDDDEDEDENEKITDNTSIEEKLVSFSFINKDAFVKKEAPVQAVPEKKNEQEPITVIGEFFRNYIAAQSGENIIFIDKHAAHERIIFERLKAQNNQGHSQMLVSGAKILLSEAEYNAMTENEDTLRNMGFEFDFSNEPFVRVTAVPIILETLDMDEVIPEIAENFLLNKQNPQTHKLDDMLHDLACKAAIKANDKNDIKELQKLAEMVFYDENIRHCPHGRPVMFTLTKRELEKQFKRIV